MGFNSFVMLFAAVLISTILEARAKPTPLFRGSGLFSNDDDHIIPHRRFELVDPAQIFVHRPGHVFTPVVAELSVDYPPSFVDPINADSDENSEDHLHAESDVMNVASHTPRGLGLFHNDETELVNPEMLTRGEEYDRFRPFGNRAWIPRDDIVDRPAIFAKRLDSLGMSGFGFRRFDGQRAAADEEGTDIREDRDESSEETWPGHESSEETWPGRQGSGEVWTKMLPGEIRYDAKVAKDLERIVRLILEKQRIAEEVDEEKTMSEYPTSTNAPDAEILGTKGFENKKMKKTQYPTSTNAPDTESLDVEDEFEKIKAYPHVMQIN